MRYTTHHGHDGMNSKNSLISNRACPTSCHESDLAASTAGNADTPYSKKVAYPGACPGVEGPLQSSSHLPEGGLGHVEDHTAPGSFLMPLVMLAVHEPARCFFYQGICLRLRALQTLLYQISIKGI